MSNARLDTRSRALRPLAALALVAWYVNPTYAIDIVAIEEHWELSVGQPDSESSAPQVSMVMSPTGHLDGQYFLFTLNHHSVPAWIPGGLQVQYWNGEEVVESKVGPQEGTLSNADEVITWVQRTSVADGQMTFEIKSGSSQTWGAFGGLGHLKFGVNTSLTNLNGYKPAVSIEGSGISFAGNRVKHLTLQKLRWFDSTGQVYELTAPIDVDADLDP
ncbi:MAG TPA: hypothetical protein VF175_01520 [Lacipirellula sp.]